MPGIEIKGRSKIANYRHGGRAEFQKGKSVFRKNPDRLEYTGKHGAKGAIPWKRKSRGKDFKTHGRDIPKRLSISDSPRKPTMLQSPRQKFIAGYGSKGKSRMPVREVGEGFKKGGRAGKFGGGRTNLLEELGRVEAEPSNRNRRAEISRVHGELNRGYKTGGRVGKLAGGVIKSIIKGGKKISKKISDAARKQDLADSMKRFEHAGPHEGEVITKRILGERTKKGDRTKAAVKDAMAAKPWAGKPHAEGGRIGLKKGGSDKKWIQKAVNPKHKGFCTPMTKKTCTPRRKALARTFKKKAKTGWG